MDVLGALTLVLLAQEMTQSDRNALYQIMGLIVTGAFGALAAFLGSKGGRGADKAAKKIEEHSQEHSQEPTKVTTGAGWSTVLQPDGATALEPASGAQVQSWRDLAAEWQERYREEAVAHDEDQALIASLRAENRRLRLQIREARERGTGI